MSGQPDVAVARLPEEVLLERELGGVRLRAGDHHAVLARREHVVREDDDAVVAGVHDADGRDAGEVLLPARLLAADLGGDVVGRDARHRLRREAGLGHADSVRALPWRVDRSRDPDRVDVRVRVRLVGVLDLDEAFGFPSPERLTTSAPTNGGTTIAYVNGTVRPSAR